MNSASTSYEHFDESLKNLYNKAYGFVKNKVNVRQGPSEKVTKSTNGSSADVKVRDHLTGAGLDNSKIGWDGKNVTYGSRTYTPTRTEDGVSFGNKNELDRFVSDIYADEGKVGVRDAFGKAGLDTSQLGWDGRNVTYKGMTYKPSVAAGGRTFGNAQEVYDFVKSAARLDGDDVIRVNQYRSPTGLYDVGYNDATGEVMIGGTAIPHLYVDENGNAFAMRSDVENAYKTLADKVGVENPSARSDKYAEDVEKVLKERDSISGKEYSFEGDDLENDPVWRAYQEMYRREGERAYEDSMARVKARTGGNMSSMSQAAADQAYAYYMQQMTDKIPEIAEQNYGRWRDSQQIDIDAKDKRLLALSDIYEKDTLADDVGYSRHQAQKDAEIQRIYDKLNLDVAKLNPELANLELESGYLGLDTAKIENEMLQEEAEQAKGENAYNIAELYGTPIPEHIAIKYGVAPNEDGTYPTINELTARKANAAWELYSQGALNGTANDGLYGLLFQGGNKAETLAKALGIGG